jgi:hypothetical protein
MAPSCSRADGTFLRRCAGAKMSSLIRVYPWLFAFGCLEDSAVAKKYLE